MKVYVLKKTKGKKYESQRICKSVLDFDLQYDENKPIGCSISDTKNFWVCAIGECGIDIEEKNRTVRESITRSLHKREQEYLSALSFGGSEWTDEFFRIWTAKEAVYKLTGLSFKQVSVLDETLEYKDELEAYKLLFSKEKDFYLSLISKDSEIELESIRYAGQSAKLCIDYAADLLSLKPYSSADLFKKLRTKGYNEDEARECIDSFIELGYLDDAEYARRFTENAMASGKGASYIKNKLALSGISAEDMPVIDKNEQYERALELAQSIYKDSDDYEQRQKNLAKVGRRLAGRGFDAATVYKVLADIKK